MALTVIRVRRKLSQLQNALIVSQADSSWFVTLDLVGTRHPPLHCSGFVLQGVTLQRPGRHRRWLVSGDRRNPSAPERPDPRRDCGALLPAVPPVGP